MAVLVLQRGDISLDAPLAAVWPDFSLPALSVASLLSHRSGLASALPSFARLRTLLEPLAMSKWLALNAAAKSERANTTAAATAGTASAGGSGSTPPGSSEVEVGAEYEGAPWGWAVAGLLHAATPHSPSPTLTDGTRADNRPTERGDGTWSLQDVFEKMVAAPLGLADELRLVLTEGQARERAATHSMGAMMRCLPTHTPYRSCYSRHNTLNCRA